MIIARGKLQLLVPAALLLLVLLLFLLYFKPPSTHPTTIDMVTPIVTPSPTPTVTPTVIPMVIPAVDILRTHYLAVETKDLPVAFATSCPEALSDTLSWYGPLLDEYYEIHTTLIGINDLGNAGDVCLFDVQYTIGDGISTYGAMDRVLMRMEEGKWCVSAMYQVER